MGRQHEDVDGAELADQLRERGDVLVETRLDVLFDDDDQVRARGRLHIGADAEIEADVGGESGETTAVDVLQHERADAAAHDDGNRGRDLVDRRERHEQRGVVLRARVDLQHGFGDDRERAFRPDDQLGEVVAGRRLHELAAGPDDVAVREHRLEAQHLVAGDAVFHGPHAAGVGGDVAAERRAVLTGIHGIDEPQGRERGVELVEAHAGTHDGDVVFRVDLDDPIHALEGEHDPVGERRAGAREAGSRAPGRDRHPQLVADAHDGRDLVGRTRPHDGQRPYGGGRQRFVVGVIVADRVAEREVRRSERVEQACFQIGHPVCVGGRVHRVKPGPPASGAISGVVVRACGMAVGSGRTGRAGGRA